MGGQAVVAATVAPVGAAEMAWAGMPWQVEASEASMVAVVVSMEEVPQVVVTVGAMAVEAMAAVRVVAWVKLVEETAALRVEKVDGTAVVAETAGTGRARAAGTGARGGTACQ